MPPFKDSILVMFHKIVILGKVYRYHQIQYVQICDLQSQEFSWILDICPIPFQLAQPHLIFPPLTPSLLLYTTWRARLWLNWSLQIIYLDQCKTTFLSSLDWYFYFYNASFVLVYVYFLKSDYVLLFLYNKNMHMH